jgi:hypothetical protein
MHWYVVMNARTSVSVEFGRLLKIRDTLAAGFKRFPEGT